MSTSSYQNYVNAHKEAAKSKTDDFFLNFTENLQTVQQTRDDVADIWPSEPISWAEFRGDF